MVKWQSSHMGLNFIPMIQEAREQPRQNKQRKHAWVKAGVDENEL